MVSVIVPNYNHAPFLKERIESILNQTYQDFELILLDDCSTDDSHVVFDGYRNHPKVTSVVYNEKNSGSPFAQWQKGISIAKGDWIWIAESDDVAESNFLEMLISNVDKYPSVGLVYSHLRWVDAHGKLMYSEEDTNDVFFYTGEEFIRQKLLYTTTIYNVSSAMFKKEIALSIEWSLFNNMKTCGDYFFYTLMSEKANVIEICNVLDNYRIHDHNTSGKEMQAVGKGFFEGMPILDRITEHYHISQRVYAMHYARLWKHARLSRDVNRKIANLFWPRYWMIVICYYLITIKWYIINKK